ncbi:MAG: histidine phosphatase family protein [Verrucomicrobiota bacterium]|nr:histidine phosphatase family protein [Verrucomicrobiota bacterium]
MRLSILTLIALACLPQAAVAQSFIFLVRHAEKATGGDAKDPDLSEAGRARAQALAAVLKDAGITAIYATEFKRTQQTAEPLAHALDLKTTITPAKEVAALVAQLKAATGNVLVVGHSNTVPEIAKAFGVLAPPEIAEADFDNLFALIPGTPARFVRLHYR